MLVDDILFFSEDIRLIENDKERLKGKFDEIMGESSELLRLVIEQNDISLSISQKKLYPRALD